MRIEYHPATITDINEAATFYNKRQAGLRDRFRNEVYATIGRIQDNPSAFPQVEGVHRNLLKHFPYSVLYRVLDQNTIRILIIRHHRRHPRYGTGRQ
ncbi:MAG: type II toxin-antitoxin system RelE/ParE family toxin [Abditibacteriaceae bacterium]